MWMGNVNAIYKLFFISVLVGVYCLFITGVLLMRLEEYQQRRGDYEQLPWFPLLFTLISAFLFPALKIAVATNLSKSSPMRKHPHLRAIWAEWIPSWTCLMLLSNVASVKKTYEQQACEILSKSVNALSFQGKLFFKKYTFIYKGL